MIVIFVLEEQWQLCGKKMHEHENLLVNVNRLRPKQNGHPFPYDIVKCIFLNENVLILIQILLNFIPMGPSNNIPALVQKMAWRRPVSKPLSKPMIINLPASMS